MKKKNTLDKNLNLRMAEKDLALVNRATDKVAKQDGMGATRSQVQRSVLLAWARGVLSKP